MSRLSRIGRAVKAWPEGGESLAAGPIFLPGQSFCEVNLSAETGHESGPGHGESSKLPKFLPLGSA